MRNPFSAEYGPANREGNETTFKVPWPHTSRMVPPHQGLQQNTPERSQTAVLTSRPCEQTAVHRSAEMYRVELIN